MRNQSARLKLRLLRWKPISQWTRPIIVGELTAWNFQLHRNTSTGKRRCLKLRHSTWSGTLFAIIIMGIIGIRYVLWWSVSFMIEHYVPESLVQPERFIDSTSCIFALWDLRWHKENIIFLYNACMRHQRDQREIM